MFEEPLEAATVVLLRRFPGEFHGIELSPLLEDRHPAFVVRMVAGVFEIEVDEYPLHQIEQRHAEEHGVPLTRRRNVVAKERSIDESKLGILADPLEQFVIL